MQIEKFNASAKLSTSKWWTFFRAVKFVDNGGINVTISLKQAESIVEKLKDGSLPVDSYGYAKFSLFPDTGERTTRGQAPKSEVPFQE